MFMITIENLLRFHEYFDDKIISMKNFPLDFDKVRSTHISCGFFTQMWKDMASKCLARSRSPREKNVIGIAQMDCV